MTGLLTRLVVGYALGRGFWHGLRGRTSMLRVYGPKGHLAGSVFGYGDGVHDDTPYLQRAMDVYAADWARG